MIASNRTVDSSYDLSAVPPVVQQIGNTPLLQLEKVLPPNKAVDIFVKAEWLNPGGSVKDRAAWWIIRQAIEQGHLKEGDEIIDATSGNTGIGYAMVCNSLDISLTLCIPSNSSPERVNILKAYGVTLVFTDPLEGTDGAIQRVKEILSDQPDRYFWADQYNNSANWQAHYNSTGPEIWDQTEGKLTHWVAAIGTTGTFVGTSRFLKEKNPNISCLTVQPDTPFHGIEGTKHIETSIVPGIYDPTLVNAEIEVTTEEAFEMTKRLAREEGLLVGFSSGAALAGIHQIAEQLESGIIVTVFPDRGERYLSEKIWE